MDDLRQRFASLDRVPAPDVWSDVERRLEALRTAAPTRRLVAVKPRWSAPVGSEAPGPGDLAARRNRAALLAAAAVIVALLIGAAFAVGSGLIRLPSIVPPPEASFSTTPPPASTEPVASPSSGPTASPGGPLGGGEILTHDLARIGDFSTHDVIALDAGTGERTLLGTLPGNSRDQTVYSYVFQENGNRNHVLIQINNRLGDVASLDAPTEASKPFGFIAKQKTDLGSALRLSPRGDQIAGVDNFDAPRSIVISGIETGSRTIPLPSGVKRLLIFLAWSPDESALVAAGCRPCNTTQTPDEHQTADHEHLYIVPLDGSPWRELLDEDNGYLSASWSPDGSTLAVTDFACVATTNMPRCPPGGTSTTSLLTVADGSVRRLANDTDRLEMTAWSPDGGRLAYVTGKAGDILGNGGIFVSDADGTHVVRVADTSNDEAPIWSPDGRWLLFKKDWSTTEWWIVPADGGVPRSIGNYGGATW